MKIPRAISFMPAILSSLMIGTVDGWGIVGRCIPHRRMIKRMTAGAAVVTTIAAAGVVGAAVVAIDRINKDGGYYEPPPGSMDRKVVLVTGGSSGLGLETVKRLAAAGATVILTSRTEAKGRRAVEDVNEYLVKKGRLPTSSEVYNLVLDLDDLSDVMRIPSRYEGLGLDRDISVLINNAGVMAIPTRELTVDGNERTFQSNHVGHFVLTSALFPYLSRNGTRVITVSSSASYLVGPGGLDVDNLNGERSYGAWSSYSASKLANVLFTRELQRRADESNLDWLTATTLHPGVVNTDLWRYIVGEERLARMKDGGGLGRLAMGATRLIAKTPEEGASTQVFLAATGDDDIVKGAFYDEMKVNANLPSFARDDVKAKSLWEASEELGGIRFILGAKTAMVSVETEIPIDENSDDASSVDLSFEDSD